MNYENKTPEERYIDTEGTVKQKAYPLAVLDSGGEGRP
jgi:hypothetical protein